MEIEYSTFSETGRRRKNQDHIQVFVDQGKDRTAFMLCSDGVYPCMAPDIPRDRMMDDRPMEDIKDTPDAEVRPRFIRSHI